MLDASSFVLSNGVPSRSSTNRSPQRNGGPMKIEDARWRFQEENQLPKPREFIGVTKAYRAGRGSSVPLDLSQFG